MYNRKIGNLLEMVKGILGFYAAVIYRGGVAAVTCISGTETRETVGEGQCPSRAGTIHSAVRWTGPTVRVAGGALPLPYGFNL